MKKTLGIILIFFAGNFFSQENLFQKIKQQIITEHPEVKIDNKLIMVNVWSVNDAKSREANVQVNKAVNIYHGAKLKGGFWGIITVLICKDADTQAASIALSKDKVTLPLNLKNANLKDADFTNILFDAKGNEINKNIAPENIYESIHQLITR